MMYIPLPPNRKPQKPMTLEELRKVVYSMVSDGLITVQIEADGTETFILTDKGLERLNKD